MKNKAKKGKVYIAGAGCGDEKLITLKLKEILEKAECIVYDRLVNENILQYAKKNVELIYMGKENTNGGKLQTKINEILIQKALQGLVVVRLKGGDPFVFGRGGEEIESLITKGIDFEVIPGISSSIAVPAYSGIPITHRGINTSFHIFTGHTKENGKELDFEVISQLDGTLVFLMGLSNIENITKNLIKYGKDTNTPVAIIKDGTTTKQKVFTGNLGNICNIVKQNNIKSPVIIIIGEVVKLREKMMWFEKKELFGKNILITRNEEKHKNIKNIINSCGGNAISMPFIDIEYIDFKMPDLSKYNLLLFNSLNSVIGFMRKIDDIRDLANIKIGVVGKKTEEEIRKYKIIPDFIPEDYTVEKLASKSVDFTKEEDNILFVVSNISPVDTKKYSNIYNRKYEKLVVYNTNKVKYKREKVLETIEKSDILMFLSSSTFEFFVENIDIINDIEKNSKIKDKEIFNLQNELKRILNGKIIASIGPITTKTIEKYGINVDIEAKKYTEEDLFYEILGNIDML